MSGENNPYFRHLPETGKIDLNRIEDIQLNHNVNLKNEDIIEIENPTAIQSFFKNQSVFITGGTGFLGKLLIDKILRSCPEVKVIYLLIRNKKGKDMNTRLDELFQDLVFTRLKKECPKFRQKVIGIEGDCLQPDLNLSPKDRDLLIQNVNIIFHAAAMVNFDAKLKTIVAINLNATKVLLDMSRKMEGLKALVYISTAFSNCLTQLIEEKIYKPIVSGENILKLSECLDENLFEEITPILTKNWPNTYAFTKFITEDFVNENSKGLPVVIYRPAIMTPTKSEPVSGWIDNVYGPTGVVVGVGAGLLRTLLVDAEALADIVPADMTINGIIASAWDRAVNNYSEVPVYNYVSSASNKISWGQYMNSHVKYGNETPVLKSLWCYKVSITRYKLLYYFYTIFLHLIPGLLIDTALILTWRKPRVLKIYKKIEKFTEVISYFTLKEWNFRDDNVNNLLSKMSENDKKMFNFDMKTLEWNQYFKDCIFGIRLYMFNESLETIPAAKIKHRRMRWIHYTIKYSVFTIIFMLLYTILKNIFL